jgi:DNA-directed RNA polymerase alpha subunit
MNLTDYILSLPGKYSKLPSVSYVPSYKVQEFFKNYNKLNADIDELNFSTRLIKILRINNINTASDILNREKLDFLKMKGMGAKSLNELEIKMKKIGLPY